LAWGNASSASCGWSRNDSLNNVVDVLDLRRALHHSTLREVESVADDIRTSASDEIVVQVSLDQVVPGLREVAQVALALVVGRWLGAWSGLLVGLRVGLLVRSGLSLCSKLTGLRWSLAALGWPESLLLASLVWRKVSVVDCFRWRIHFW
jgi:hypothetical protein